MRIRRATPLLLLWLVAACASGSRTAAPEVEFTDPPWRTPGSAASVAPAATQAPVAAARPKAAPPAVSTVAGEVVKTSYGDVRGGMANGVRSFLAIPYAAAPVGQLRWKEPVSPAKWTDVRDATRMGPACPSEAQDPLNQRSIGGPKNLPMSEDCLQLNVWTPAGASGRPVMVWIHGGGFSIGSAAMPVYDGANPAKLGVVVVTINYRLGVLGFLAHAKLTEENPNKTSGNWAFYDQILALKWVQQNIGAFGGDAKNVTIFGESAGAVSVTTLMALPAAKGLFHKAIAQSGSPSAQLPPRGPSIQPGTAEYRGEQFAQKLGVATAPDVVAAMRAKPYEDVLRAWREATSADNTGSPGDSSKVLVSIDGHLITEPPAQAFFQGRQARVPFVAGSMMDDGSLWAKPVYDGGVKTVESYNQYVNRTYGLKAPDVKKLYPVSTDDEVWDALVDLASDPIFVCPARALARVQAPVVAQTFLYQFTRIPDSQYKQLGAFHGLDVAYVFGTLPPIGGAERKLSDEIMTAWTTFASSGSPGVAAWPRYAKAEDRHGVLNLPLASGEKLRTAQCDYWIPNA